MSGRGWNLNAKINRIEIAVRSAAEHCSTGHAATFSVQLSVNTHTYAPSLCMRIYTRRALILATFAAHLLFLKFVNAFAANRHASGSVLICANYGNRLLGIAPSWSKLESVEITLSAFVLTCFALLLLLWFEAVRCWSSMLDLQISYADNAVDGAMSLVTLKLLMRVVPLTRLHSLPASFCLYPRIFTYKPKYLEL